MDDPYIYDEEKIKDIPVMSDRALIALWGHFTILLEQLKILGLSSEALLSLLGGLEREMDLRGIHVHRP